VDGDQLDRSSNLLGPRRDTGDPLDTGDTPGFVLGGCHGFGMATAISAWSCIGSESHLSRMEDIQTGMSLPYADGRCPSGTEMPVVAIPGKNPSSEFDRTGKMGKD
jgi:hypothetical protein